jgi:hypothetical protein
MAPKWSVLVLLLAVGAARAGDTSIVADRPDPTSDPGTIALLDLQAGTARRFALAQIGNVHTRLQTLRLGATGRCAGRDRAPVNTPPAAARTTPKNGLFEYAPQQQPSLSLPLADCRMLADRATTLWTAGAFEIGAGGGRGFRFDSQGVTLGGDVALPSSFAVGGGIGFARSGTGAAPAGATATGASATTMTAYLSYRPRARLYFEAMFGAGAAAFDSTRAGANGGEASGTRHADLRFVSIAAGRQFVAAGWKVNPHARIDRTHAVLRAATETGSGTAALAYSDERVPSLKLVAGATAQGSFSTRLGTLLPHASLEYRHQLERSEAALVRYADGRDGAAYQVVASGIERGSTTLNAGATLLLPSRRTLGLECSLDRSTAARSGRIDARVSRVF